MWDIVDFILHLDEKLEHIAKHYGWKTYLVLFFVIFAETGLVITPFLPGDSLLFLVGATASDPASGLNIWVMWAVLFAAAVLGDTVNYHVGHYLGPKVLKSETGRWLNRKHLEETHRFFERHGGKTIILGRFMPIIRTFAPFVAGVGAMEYVRFLMFNVLGGFIWVTLFVVGGYHFGKMEIVRNNFWMVLVVIIGLSMVPVVFTYIQTRKSGTKPAVEPAADPEKESSVG